MRNRRIEHSEFEDLKKLSVKRHWKWPAVFSTNSKGELWPWVCNGPTPKLDRTDVRGLSPVLEEIASSYTAVREAGGRIFIKDDCATWKDSNLTEHVLFVWEFAGPKPYEPPARTRDECMQEIRKNFTKKRANPNTSSVS